MAAKYVKVKKVVIPFLTVLMIVSQVTGIIPITSAEAAEYNRETPEVVIELVEFDEKQSDIKVTEDEYAETRAAQALYAAAQSKTGFVDVDDSKYYADAIKWAVDNKITYGIGNSQFGIDSNVTRGQAVTFLWRAVGSPSPNGTGETFEDVEEGSWYELAVKWAVENHITEGVGGNKFDPNGLVTRGQMITFLWRTKGAVGEARQGDQWYSAAERWAQSKGLLTGTAQAYTTNGECPRCDVVYYLWKEVKNIGNTGGSNTNNNNSNTNNTGSDKVDPSQRRGLTLEDIGPGRDDGATDPNINHTPDVDYSGLHAVC